MFSSEEKRASTESCSNKVWHFSTKSLAGLARPLRVRRPPPKTAVTRDAAQMADTGAATTSAKCNGALLVSMPGDMPLRAMHRLQNAALVTVFGVFSPLCGCIPMLVVMGLPQMLRPASECACQTPLALLALRCQPAPGGMSLPPKHLLTRLDRQMEPRADLGAPVCGKKLSSRIGPAAGRSEPSLPESRGSAWRRHRVHVCSRQLCCKRLNNMAGEAMCVVAAQRGGGGVHCHDAFVPCGVHANEGDLGQPAAQTAQRFVGLLGAWRRRRLTTRMPTTTTA